jgi:hypothetical protein
VDYEVFYEAPSRLWKTKPLEEFEMEAIMVSAAMYGIQYERWLIHAFFQSGGATNVSA